MELMESATLLRRGYGVPSIEGKAAVGSGGVPAMHKLGEGRPAVEIYATKMASARIALSGYSLPETIAMKVAGSIFAVSRTRCR